MSPSCDNLGIVFLPLRLVHSDRYRQGHDGEDIWLFKPWRRAIFRSFVAAETADELLTHFIRFNLRCPDVSLNITSSISLLLWHGPVSEVQPPVRFILVHTVLVLTVGLLFLFICFLKCWIKKENQDSSYVFELRVYACHFCVPL